LSGITIQLRDVDRAQRDTVSVDGRIAAAGGANPLTVGDASGLTLTTYETVGGQLVPLASKVFAASDCRATGGSSPGLYCRDRVTRSTVRLRGSGSAPDTYRVIVRLKGIDITPGRPFTPPLVSKLVVGSRFWLGKASVCSVAAGGERMTCQKTF
jgi:hypothetical protein